MPRQQVPSDTLLQQRGCKCTNAVANDHESDGTTDYVHVYLYGVARTVERQIITQSTRNGNKHKHHVSKLLAGQTNYNLIRNTVDFACEWRDFQ